VDLLYKVKHYIREYLFDVIIIKYNTYFAIRTLTRLGHNHYIGILIREFAISKDRILVYAIFVALSNNLVKLVFLLFSTAYFTL
jgi:hypothetical protein